MNIKIRYLLLSFLVSTSSMHSIPQECAYVGGAAAGALVAIVSYRGLQPIKYLAVPMSVVGGYFGYSFFYKFTPAGRIERAEKELNIIRGYRLSQDIFIDEHLLLNTIYDLYRLHTWPLVIALDDLTRYMDRTLKSIELANAAEQADNTYCDRARKVKQMAYSGFENMNKAAKAIRTSRDYFVQLGQFKEEQRHREQLQVQQSIAAAQWAKAQAQQQIATTQKELIAAQQHNAHAQKPAAYSNSGKVVQSPSNSTGVTNALTPSSSSTLSGFFTEREATDYIAQSINALERALETYMRRTDLTTLKHAIQNSVRNAHYAYQNGTRRISKDIIDQVIASAVLEYIEKAAYDYAYNSTKDSSASRRISESMRNNALALIAQKNVVDFELLVPFVGFALEKAINDKIQYAAPVAQATPASKSTEQSVQVEKQYKSSECCICLEDFDEDVKRVYLSPCGHDMCTNCAYDWFFGIIQKTTCPQCRGSVNLNKLQETII